MPRAPHARRLLRAALALVLGIQGAIFAGPTAAETTAGFVTVGPFTFQIGHYRLRTLPDDLLPYNGTTIVPNCGRVDPLGVAMYRDPSGDVHDHPVAQGQCAVNMLRNYRLDPDPHYLDVAIAQAERLLTEADVYRGALFFAYRFTYTNPDRSVMRPPWYSSMAQGLALSAFTRLSELTGEARWTQAAHHTFASYLVSRAMGGPWHVTVENGQLWFDEYPSVPADKVFNGHNFSIFGLYDYWRRWGSAEASGLLSGALHTSYLAASWRIRVPGDVSRYCASNACLAHDVRNPHYHAVHIGQLAKLHEMTGDRHFASLAEAFGADSR